MFLIWWYTEGLFTVIQRLRRRAVALVQALHLKKLGQYLFVPMYGYNDIWSRLISFPVRLVQLAVLLTFAIVYLVVEIVLVVVWFALPLLVIINIVYQLPSIWK